MLTYGWYDLGRFKILVKPLPDNPAFSTHHVYVGKVCVGRQLSAPSLQDCESRAREHQGEHQRASTARPFSVPLAKHNRCGQRTASRGPRNNADARDFADAIIE